MFLMSEVPLSRSYGPFGVVPKGPGGVQVQPPPDKFTAIQTSNASVTISACRRNSEDFDPRNTFQAERRVLKFPVVI